MKLLVVAPTEMEIVPFLKQHDQPDILITGPGAPGMIYHLTKKILTEKYDLAIQARIAGTFDNCFTLEEVVLVKEDTSADLGMDENGCFRTLFETGFIDNNDWPYTDGRLVNSHPIFDTTKLPVANALTVNKITSDPSQIKMMQQKFAAEVESMEGAAFHYVCLQENIPFLQIRAISNTVGERDKAKWRIKNAVANLNRELLEIIEELRML